MSTVIEWLADSLVAGSIVMMIVMLIRGVILRKMPRRYAYLLWAVVAIRLVCPVSIESPLSVFNYVPEVKLVQKHSAQSDTMTSTDMDSKSDTISNGQTSPFSEAYRADGMETKHAGDAVFAGNMDQDDNKESALSDQETREETSTQEDGHRESVTEKTAIFPSITQETATDAVGTSPLMLILFLLWALGVGVFLMKNVIDGVKLHKRLRTAVRLEKGVYESDMIDTPFVKGIIRPRIYIPFRLSDHERACILAHEKHHIHRGDPIFKLFATVLLTVFWFHPLVWVSYRLMVRDMEMSCDEYVLTHEANDIRASYSTLLLAFATNRRIVDGVLFFGENDTKQRVKHVLGFKKKHMALGLIAILVVVLTSACTLTGKAMGESLKINDISDGEAVSGQAVSGEAVSGESTDMLLSNKQNGMNEVDTDTKNNTDVPLSADEIKDKYREYFDNRQGEITVSGIDYWTPEMDVVHNNDIDIDLGKLSVYCYYDINEDGMPEMIISDGDHRFEGGGISPYTLLICSYKSGKVVPVFGIIGIRGEAYRWEGKGICAFFGGSDFGEYVFYRMTDDGFEYEERYYMLGMHHDDSVMKKKCNYYNKSNHGEKISKEKFNEVVDSLYGHELMQNVHRSSRYTEEDINSAIKVVKGIFKDMESEVDDFRLYQLYYSGDGYSEDFSDWADRNNADEVIVLKSEFYIGDSKNTTLNDYFTYENYNWILVRKKGGNWVEVDQGY